MKPKPLALLKNFTVPVIILCSRMPSHRATCATHQIIDGKQPRTGKKTCGRPESNSTTYYSAFRPRRGDRSWTLDPGSRLAQILADSLRQLGLRQRGSKNLLVSVELEAPLLDSLRHL